MTTSVSGHNPVFDYRALRFLVGLVAFALPVVVWLISCTRLSSISASYYTEARDVLVGSLFVISALLWAYNGHTPLEKWVSKVASLAAIVVALCPTSCDDCEGDARSIAHGIAAVVLFATIAFFCLGPFRKDTKGQAGKKGRRAKIYFVCGWIIVGCMAGAGAAEVIVPSATREACRIMFWAESIALWAFGVAWIVAGKVLGALVDEADRLRLA